MAAVFCMILLDDVKGVDPAKLEAALKENAQILAGAEDVVSDFKAEESHSASGQIGETQIIWSPMPIPVPLTDLEPLFDHSMFWQDAQQVVPMHKSHWIVAATGSEDLLEMTIALTIAVVGALKSETSALGVYWGNGSNLIDKESFCACAQDFLPDSLPVMLWINCITAYESAAQQLSIGYTTGMGQFELMDVECLHAPEAPNVLWDRMLSLCDYQIQNGPVIEDGDTVGADENEIIRVVYCDSQFGAQGQVMRLTFE